jgi:tetratricopeptide (TPR) repeat protein
MKAATADGTVEPTPDEAVRDNSDGDIAARASAGWFSRMPTLVGGALLMALAVAVFANGLAAPFYLDDNESLERQPAIRTLTTAWRTQPTRRIGTLSFALNYRFHGLDARGFRAVNIMIHGWGACILFGFARRTLSLPGIPPLYSARANALALAIAAIWLVHPLQTGAVTYVVQRFESLMGLFFLFSLYGLARGGGPRPSWIWLSASLASLALAAQTKEITAVFPIVALAYDRAFLADGWRETLRRRWWYHLATIVVTAWMVYQIRGALVPERAASAGFGVATVTPWEYLRSQAGVLVHYLWLCVWPRTLCLDYRWPVAQTPWEIYPQGAFILGLAAATAWAVFRVPRGGFLGVCFFAILAPTSSFMPIADLAFEHRMYLPLASITALIVLGAVAISSRVARADGIARIAPPWASLRTFQAVLACVVLVALSARTVARHRDYVDPVRMWSSVLAVSPWNPRAHHQLALQFERRGQLKDAERHFHETLRYRPDAWWVDIGLGNLRIRESRLEEAEQHFRRAAQSKAGVGLAAANLGRLREREKKWDEAVTFYNMAVARNPGHLDIWLAKANAHAQLRQAKEAAAAYQHVLELDPRSAEAKRGLARWKTRERPESEGSLQDSQTKSGVRVR